MAARTSIRCAPRRRTGVTGPDRSRGRRAPSAAEDANGVGPEARDRAVTALLRSQRQRVRSTVPAHVRDLGTTLRHDAGSRQPDASNTVEAGNNVCPVGPADARSPGCRGGSLVDELPGRCRHEVRLIGVVRWVDGPASMLASTGLSMSAPSSRADASAVESPRRMRCSCGAHHELAHVAARGQRRRGSRRAAWPPAGRPGRARW